MFIVIYVYKICGKWSTECKITDMRYAEIEYAIRSKNKHVLIVNSQQSDKALNGKTEYYIIKNYFTTIHYYY